MAIEEFKEVSGSELIQDIFLFKNLNFSEAHELAKICQREKFGQGEVIIEENSLGQALFIIEAGEVKVVKGEGRSAREITRLGRGELFGEMSLIENELTSASVIAGNEVSVLVIHRPQFEELLEKDLSLALKVYKSFCHTLSERLRKTTAELSKLQDRLSAQPKAKPKPNSRSKRIARRKK